MSYDPTGIYYPEGIDVGDFNEDGNLDIVVPSLSGFVNVLIGRPNGTFVDPVNYQCLDTYTGKVFARQFYNTGHLDLLTDNGSLFKGNGDGTFQPAASWQGGDRITVGDFNNDGFMDVAAAFRNGEKPGFLNLYLNNHDGTFTAGNSVRTGADPEGFAIGDFNRDGNLDLAICCYDSFTSVINIVFNDGSGTLTTVHTYPVPNFNGLNAGPLRLKAIDLRRSGIVDLIVVNAVSDSIAVFLGNGDGSFQPAIHYPTLGTAPQDVVFGDFNHDGNIDLAVVSQQVVNAIPYVPNPGIDIFLGNGNGTLQPAKHYKASFGRANFAIGIGDFNHDGNLDIALAGFGNVPDLGAVAIMLGSNDGSFYFLGDYGTNTRPPSPPPYVPTGVIVKTSVNTVLSFRQKTKTNPVSGIASNVLSFGQIVSGPENRKQKLSSRLGFIQGAIADVSIRNLRVSNYLQHDQVAGRLFTENIHQIYFPYQPFAAHSTGDLTLKLSILLFRQDASAFAAKPANNILTFNQNVTFTKQENPSVGNTLIFNQGVEAFNTNFNACDKEFNVFPPLPGA